MGVRGLTTFINSNSQTFFVEFKLHDCTLIIDGNSLAAVLYSATLSPHSAFGGNYDIYAEYAENFIKNLKQCNVEPVFIFDGGYERKKESTVRKRNAMKVYAIDKVTPARPTKDFFPLMMRSVLQERLLELGVVCLQSDYEADREIAAIAKLLNAPVLSNDSDFFIFDIPFIPFSHFSFDICHKSSSNKSFHYFPCQIFYIDNFLKIFGGLQKDMLPLLATILGNDYLNRSTFKNLFGLIKLDKKRRETLGQRRVGGLVNWLRKESFNGALQKILTSLPKKRRPEIRKDILSIIGCYSNLSTCLESCLPMLTNEITISKNCDQICSEISNLNIKDDDADTNYASSSGDCDENLEDNISEHSHEDSFENEEAVDEKITETIQQTIETDIHSKIPEWIFERSRKCQIPPQIITLLTLRIYFCVPQMEDCSLPQAGEIGIPILQIIAGLCLGESFITYWCRHGYNEYRRRKLIISEKYSLGELPKLYSLHNCPYEERKKIVLNTLNIENDRFLQSFPEEWHLFVMCLVYWIKNKETMKPFYVHAVIFMFIVVNVFTKKIGCFRKTKSFTKKYGAKVKSLEKIREKCMAKVSETNTTVIQQFSEITKDDCLVSFENILPNFNVDVSLRDRPRTFQRQIIHYFAELQVVLDLAQMLNSLLLQPYKRMHISRFYNGTFLYNITAVFKQQKDIFIYLEKIFKKSPTVLNLHVSFFKELYNFVGIMNIIVPIINNKKHKKHKKRTITKTINTEVDIVEESDCEFQDENNKFSVLSVKL